MSFSGGYIFCISPSTEKYIFVYLSFLTEFIINIVAITDDNKSAKAPLNHTPVSSKI